MNLAKIRKQRGETQRSLAAKVGVTDTAISNYEIGIREPRLKTLKKIASALECSVSELIEDDDDDREISGMPEAAAELSQ